MTSPRKKTVKPTQTALEPTLEPKPKLSRDLILKTAAEIADRDGIKSLTMRKLAQALSVEAMSIYHHVANKNDLQDGMINLVFAEMELPSRAVHWKSALRTRAISAHQILIRHPWAIGLELGIGTVPGPATLQHHNAVLGYLREGGFSLSATAHAYSVLDSYIYGFALNEINLPFKTADDVVDIAASMMAQMVNNPYPYMAEMITQHALQPEYAYTDEFEIGLELILDGLERWREVF